MKNNTESPSNLIATPINKLPSVQVIVAHYEESLDWLPALPEDYTIYISHSGKTDPVIPKIPNKLKVVKVANEGREAGHWIRYTADNYNDLADINIFLQGSPHIGHTPDILFHMERSDVTEPFAYLMSKDFNGTRIDGNARTLIQSAIGRKYTIVPQATGGVWGGQHYATRETLQKYPEEHYRAILKFSETEHFAHKIEHAYNCVYGIAPKA